MVSTFFIILVLTAYGFTDVTWILYLIKKLFNWIFILYKKKKYFLKLNNKFYYSNSLNNYIEALLTNALLAPYIAKLWI